MGDPLLELCDRIEREHKDMDGDPICSRCSGSFDWPEEQVAWPCDALRAARALRVLVEGYLEHDNCCMPDDRCTHMEDGVAAAREVAEEKSGLAAARKEE